MTRQKKSRSLKRIHKVKTGSASKLKKQAPHDRQGTKKVKKRVPSAYEKYLAEHPEAARQAKASTQKPSNKSQEDAKKAASISKTSEAEKYEPKKSLLDQLDDKDFGDIY